ncbi:MAG: hypothetical protein M5U34_03005 [Chloroflexi bacterium]|nr:hypothetical protein [Chloroflexota bacterium]
MIIYPLIISYTIVRYRLMETDVVVRRGVTYLIILGAMVGVLVLISTGLSAAFGDIIIMNNPFVLALVVILWRLYLIRCVAGCNGGWINMCSNSE